MKLKYYLRGMGIGIILTAIVMGFALGGRKAALSDAEIIQRAKLLGMVEGDTGPLLDTQNNDTEETKDDTSSPDQALDKEGKEISEKDQQEVPEADNGSSEVAGEKKEGEAADSEDQQASDSSQAEASTQEGDSSAVTAGDSSTESTSKIDASTELATDTEDEFDEAGQSIQDVKEETQADTTATETPSTENTAKVSGKTITIPGGMGSDQVAQILYKEGLIDDALTFNRYLIDRRLDRVIRSGVKVIPDGADYEQIAGIITTG
jgi:hypothetical protein